MSPTPMHPAPDPAAVEHALERFSTWLDELSPYHRALRTPVCLEPDAPRLVRAFWDRVGWSNAIGPVDAAPWIRPERSVMDREAMKVIRGWLSAPQVREAWGVSAPGDVESAVRSRLPARSRFTFASRDLVGFTDETGGLDDPPVLLLRKDGAPTLRWPSYVEYLLWTTCKSVAAGRGPRFEGGQLVPARPDQERPFGPALQGFWTLGEGVWAIGPAPARTPAAASPRSLEQVVYRSQEDYFRFVNALPDGEIERFVPDMRSMDGFRVADAQALDPEHPTAPSFRRYQTLDAKGRPQTFWGLAELEGARIWLQKDRGGRTTVLYAEPEQAELVKTYIQRQKLKVVERSKGDRSALADPPGPGDLARAKELHDQALAAEGSR